jgi:fructose-bisphosphate aldolase class I
MMLLMLLFILDIPILCLAASETASPSTINTCSTIVINNNNDPTWQSMHSKILSRKGFLAALDQSGGSTPKALKLYGVSPEEYNRNENEGNGDGNVDDDTKMYDMVHEMRTRIITSPCFVEGNILGAILFENTMDRTISEIPTAQYLWEQKQIVPFLKIDKGLAEEERDENVQLMKPIPDLTMLLEKARSYGIYGTKMRSLIHHANPKGIQKIVAQQFEVARTILQAGLTPIIEPEVNIHAHDKLECEELLKQELLNHLDTLDKHERVMLKLTLPTQQNFYKDCIAHPNVVCVLALSGGYSRDDANQLLSQNPGMMASFSRALTEGLTKQQTDDKFHATLAESIETILQASAT